MNNKRPSNTLVEFEFYNRTKTTVQIWVEPTCISIELDNDTEYKLLTPDRFFRLEFDHNGQLIFYLQYSFGVKLFKREAVAQINNPNEWLVELDWLDIN